MKAYKPAMKLYRLLDILTALLQNDCVTMPGTTKPRWTLDATLQAACAVLRLRSWIILCN